MPRRKWKGRIEVPNRTIVTAILMLVGIVTLALGYLQNDRQTLYAGLVITLAGVLPSVVFSLPWWRAKRRNPAPYRH